jgi:hypothetical protein
VKYQRIAGSLGEPGERRIVRLKTSARRANYYSAAAIKHRLNRLPSHPGSFGNGSRNRIHSAQPDDVPSILDCLAQAFAP